MHRLIIFLSFCCITGCRQRSANDKETSGNINPEYFESKYVRLVKDTSIMMLIENVKIGYGELNAESDSVLLDKPNKSVIIYGIKKLKFKGEEIRDIARRDSIRYRLGDSKLNIH